MWWTIAFNVVKTLLVGFIKSWRAEHEKEKEIADAVAPYKAEAEALAAAPDSKHGNVERLRGLHED